MKKYLEQCLKYTKCLGNFTCTYGSNEIEKNHFIDYA